MACMQPQVSSHAMPVFERSLPAPGREGEEEEERGEEQAEETGPKVQPCHTRKKMLHVMPQMPCHGMHKEATRCHALLLSGMQLPPCAPPTTPKCLRAEREICSER